MTFLITCKENFEKITAAEMALYKGKLTAKGRGWILIEWQAPEESSQTPADLPELCFAHTILENPSIISAGSVNALGDKLSDLFLSYIAETRIDYAWSYLFSSAGEDNLIHRASAVEKRWMDNIRKKISRVSKLAQKGIPHDSRFNDGFFVYFTSFDQAYVSFGALSGGQQRMQMDSLAPSRSYLKLEEAFHIFGRAPLENDTVIDLGAAPGGWSYSAAQHGAYVTAVDNGPLKGAADQHPRITHLTIDAFSFRSHKAEPADWMLCDILEDPEIILELLHKWLKERWCKHFIVNLKVGRTNPVTILKIINDPEHNIAHYCKKLIIRQLHHDREEITLMGQLK